MKTSLLIAGFLVAAISLRAQSPAPVLAGFTTGTCLANSDTVVSLPFSRPAEFVGSVASVSGTTVAVTGSTGWRDNQFVYGAAMPGGTQHNTYYALIGTRETALRGSVSLTSGTNLVTGAGTIFVSQISPGDGFILTGSPGGYYIVQAVSDDTHLVLTGTARNTLAGQSASVSKSAKEGRAFPVTGNSSSTFTLNTNGEDVSAIQPGTRVSLVPYWTLATVFPPSDINVSYIPSASTGSYQTQILLPAYGAPGIDNPPEAAYYYSSATSRWQKEGGSADAGDVTFVPDGFFTIRNASTPTTLTMMGSVNTQKLAVPLLAGPTPAAAQQDNFVSITRPLPVALNDLNLIASGAFASTDSLDAVKDELLLYDNTVAGIDKVPSPKSDYIYMGGMWQALGSAPGVDHGGDVIPAGAAILIRKTGATGTAQFWVNPPTY